MSLVSQKEISEHQKELARRKSLAPDERARLAREDNLKAHQRKLDAAAKVEDRIKVRNKIISEIKDHANAMAEAWQKLAPHDLDTYQMLINPDCLFGDSPMSPLNTSRWLLLHLHKKGLSFLAGHPDGPEAIQDFWLVASDASKWMMKFTKAKAPIGTGLEEILKKEK